ncbi:hypothetical protein GDO81_023025 [Engystomops pustulosus]|uniref:Uncharacterized protein n=1 Tax=Engystomops pustulosus TaxID=76066 RepID=A0AAV6YWA7_ENGPU|nr:hypothetical protein GDO81_023025 [Engystomops pustulosus]KAG8538250.1 hypothetical protein GDO81_023025 [Engystomops pustulosus]KAG8538251.1 hypothetical protein GDO81_023025 [Engystomops pustulosus]KAG8538252.1 hypothetical protein GDO81_023025 [Engystomops pustulosus]KAG8538253.1 hypothetical protein GDO81_023025 [Engystomops pustulosus]
MNERAVAQTRLTGNPYDLEALFMLNRAQEQIDAWAQSTSIPGQFTGSTGAQVLSAEEISNSGPQAWLKKVYVKQAELVALTMQPLRSRPALASIRLVVRISLPSRHVTRRHQMKQSSFTAFYSFEIFANLPPPLFHFGPVL